MGQINSPASAPAQTIRAIKPTLEISALPVRLTPPRRVLLIVPPGTVEENYGRLSGAAGELPMLGLAYIAAALRDQGHEVKVIDYEVERLPMSRVEPDIRAFAPDVVGMTAYITSMRRCAAVAKIVKRVDPAITVIIGGPQVSVFPEEAFNAPDFDMIVLSEGEYIIRNVMNALGDEAALRQVKGIWFRAADGTIVRNPREELIVNLDIVPPPALDLFPMTKYYPPVYVRGKKVAHLLTSRGCPFKCTFCETKLTFGRSFRYNSTARVIAEMGALIEQGYDAFQFYDDIFTINKDRVEELCQAIIDLGWRIKWMCFTRTNCLSDSMLDLMKRSGCYLIAFGGESGNDELLYLIKKGLTVEKNREGIATTRRHGILTYSTFMLGLPTETPAMTEKTIRFALDSGLDYGLFPIFEPYPGTEIWNDIEKYGTFDDSGRYRNNLLSDHARVWVPTGRSRDDLERCSADAMKRFYLRPRQIALGLLNAVHAPVARVSRYFFSGLTFFLKTLFTRSTGGARY